MYVCVAKTPLRRTNRRRASTVGCPAAWRRATELRVGDAGEQVRRSRTERGQADSGIGREASVDVGHERRALLVAREDEADLVALGECGVQSEGLFTGDPKYVLYALVLETPNEKLRDIHDLIGCLHRSPGKRE